MSGQFVHLHVHSEYSLLDGAARIPRLVAKAKDLGMPAIALTDHGVMYGAIDFYKEALKQGIKPIIGCEAYIAGGSRFDKTPAAKENSYHVVLLAENDTGYRNLLRLVSLAQLEGFYYKPRLDKELLAQYKDGIICLSACLAGEIPVKILSGDIDGAERSIKEYLAIFGSGNFFLEVQNHFLPEDKPVNEQLIKFARQYGIGLVATNDLHYINRKDSEAQDILMCIQTGRTVEEEGRMKFANDEFYLKSQEEMQALFPELPEALDNTVKIAERCNARIEFGRLFLPEFQVPEGYAAQTYLSFLCEQALPVKYPGADRTVRERLAYELGVIHDMGFDSYFLIVWDFVSFARRENIAVGPGRGSAAGSIVSYLLGITSIDPLKYNLLFERFLNPERISMPDIDIDFCYVRRQEVFDYIVRRYGSERVAQIITFGTMAARAAVRDVGRVLGIPYNEVDKIAKEIPAELGITLDKALAGSKELQSARQSNAAIDRLLNLAKALEGTPRHASTHAAGVVIAPRPLTEFLPLQYSSEDFVTTQYDKDRVEEIGLLKMDLLGLRTLTVIADALANIEAGRGIRVDMEKIDLADGKTCRMLSDGETAGVFQMESAGMTQLVKDLKPERFEDLIALVALYRPGPLNTGMVSDFVAGRHGKKQSKSLHPVLEPILRDTFGVILYQEQVMQIAATMSGFTLAQADILRRAMGKKKPEEMAAQKEAFIVGAQRKGVEKAVAAEVFALLEHFAGYGFNKSHSAAYGLLAYQTAWLKTHYPVEFMAAMLTSVMEHNDKVSQYIEVCRRMGVKVLPPDVNASGRGFSVDAQNVRFGLAGVKNVGDAAIESIVKTRSEGGRFSSLVDFCGRVEMRAVNKRVLESLIKCGAFDSMGKRSQLMSILEKAISIAAQKQKDDMAGQMGLFDSGDPDARHDLALPDLPEISKKQMLSEEKEMTGFYVTGHPLDHYRDKLAGLPPIAGILENKGQEGGKVVVGGIISCLKRMNTKKGDAMASIVLEDFTASLEVLVFPKVFARVTELLAAENTVSVRGRLSVDDDAVKVIAEDVVFLDDLLASVRINLAVSQENGPMFAAIKTILQRYKGASPVFIALPAAGSVIKVGRELWVDTGQRQLLTELGGLLGEKNVRLL